MEIALRAALIAWLATDPVLAEQVNAVSEEAPSRTSPPWLAIASSASADWSTKDRAGREVRISLELLCRGDAPDTAADLVSAIEARVAALPADQPGYRVVTCQFLSARALQTGESSRRFVLEYRFRLLAD